MGSTPIVGSERVNDPSAVPAINGQGFTESEQSQRRTFGSISIIMVRYNRSYKSRSTRRLSSRNQKRLIWTVILSAVTLYVVFFWILPNLIGGLAILKKPSTPTQTDKADISIAPPVLNIPFDATNSALINFNGFTSPENKVEIYVNGQLQKEISPNSEGNFAAYDIRLDVGSNYITSKSVIDGKKSLSSKEISILYNSDKPELTLNEPADNTTVNGGDKKINISGQTQANNNIKVNNTIVVLDREGNFASSVKLNDGDNIITISAENRYGNKTEIQRKVIYNPEPSPTPTPSS